MLTPIVHIGRVVNVDTITVLVTAKKLYVMKVWILDAMPLYTSYTVSFSSSYALNVLDIILVLQ